jgi:hypothetical protein
MKVFKITSGFVSQEFDTETGKWVSQSFTAGDDFAYEDAEGNSLDDDSQDAVENAYLPFDMVQPE